MMTAILAGGPGAARLISKHTFSYTGGDQTVAVPTGATYYIFKGRTGAGGGPAPGGSAVGGSAVFAKYRGSCATLVGQNLTVKVGAGGLRGGETGYDSTNYGDGGGGGVGTGTHHGGQGAGRTALVADGAELHSIGAPGGAGGEGNSPGGGAAGNGGDGGDPSGEDGTDTTAANGGGGATPSTEGAGGTGGGTGTAGAAGSGQVGGAGGNGDGGDSGGGGGGGGGLKGGGGGEGGQSGVGNTRGAGGGAGSSSPNADEFVAGIDGAAPVIGDPDFTAGEGAGGTASDARADDGYAVVEFYSA